MALYYRVFNPELRKAFDITDGHDHDGVNSPSLSPSAVVATDSVTTIKILDGAVTTPKLGAASVSSAKIVDGAVVLAKIGADAVDGTKIADESIDSEHYVDGSIDTAHYALLSVDTGQIAADAIDGTKIADESIDSEHYVDGSIDTAHFAALAVDAAALAADSVITAKILDDNVTNAKLVNIARGSIKVGGASDAPSDLVAKTDKYILVGDGTDITSVAVSGDVTVTNLGAFALAADSVDSAEIADDAVDSEHIADAAIDTVALALTTTPMAKAIVAAHAAAIPVTGNGDLALTIADAAETNTLAVPTFAGQEISISCDTLAGTGSRAITVASAINATGNDTITLDAAGQFIALRGVKLGASFAWHVIANDGATLETA